MGYFSKIYAEELPHRAKSVYMYLKDRSNQRRQWYPSIGTIGKNCTCHGEQWRVEHAIDDLICAGFLTKEQRWRENGGGAACFFTLVGPSDIL